MRKIENDCVGCTSQGLPCMGGSCPNRKVVRYYCDNCGEQVNLYEFEGEQLCIDCIVERLPAVEGSE